MGLRIEVTKQQSPLNTNEIRNARNVHEIIKFVETRCQLEDVNDTKPRLGRTEKKQDGACIMKMTRDEKDDASRTSVEIVDAKCQTAFKLSQQKSMVGKRVTWRENCYCGRWKDGRMFGLSHFQPSNQINHVPQNDK